MTDGREGEPRNEGRLTLAWGGCKPPMYTEDAVFLESSGPMSGRQALLDMAKTMTPLSSVTITPLRTVGHGDLAYVYCTGSWINGRSPNVGSKSAVRAY